MQRLTVFSIERETDITYKSLIHNFDPSRLWKVAYRKDNGGGGVAWANGDDELSAFINFKNAKLNSEESIKDKFEVVLGTEQ